MSTLRVVAACLSVLCAAHHVQGVRDDELTVLSKQVKTLVERRTEDLKNIEENVRKIVFKGPEVEELRDQVRSLRLEIDELRSGTTPPVRQQAKNDKMTVKWLSNAVTELKTETAELQAALNSSAILQNHEMVDARLSLFKSDVSNLNRELQAVRKQNVKYEAELTVMREEFAILRAEWKKMASVNGEIKNQLKSLQAEATLPPLEDKDVPHAGRHQKALRRHLQYLHKSTKTLHKENYWLKSKLARLERELNDLKSTRENKIQINAEAIANLTKQTVNLDKLHMSMLELLENVETIENKVDKTVPEFRKEISKVEVQVSQAAADISMLTEEQNNMKDSMKAISFSVSDLQEKTNGHKDQLARVEDHVKALEKSNAVQHSRLHDHILKDESDLDSNATKSTIHLVEELKSFESEYKSIVNKLPRDCGSVEGPKGIYLISPGDGEPILARCDSGWTTIQKRHDGSINFNRNWNEYSNGFGSATGEHWLGNRNLHHLTKENCSVLQINMKDIYGKYWQATYNEFNVGDYADGFRLVVGGYRGNASDAMNYQNKMEFSTVDNDRDISNTHCASNYEGGWWFSHCQHANLNGRYNLGLTWFDSSRNEWIAVSESEMKVRRRDVC